MGWWQRASQMLLNLMKKLFCVDKQIVAEMKRFTLGLSSAPVTQNMKTNYQGTVNSCLPKRFVFVFVFVKHKNTLPGDGQLLPPKTLGHTKSRVLVKHRAEFPPPEKAHKNFPPTEPLHNKYKFPSAQIFINFLHLTKLV